MQETDRTSYRGGEELRRAAAVLAGPVGNRTEQVTDVHQQHSRLAMIR
jgi:hypothetical protein